MVDAPLVYSAVIEGITYLNAASNLDKGCIPFSKYCAYKSDKSGANLTNFHYHLTLLYMISTNFQSAPIRKCQYNT